MQQATILTDIIRQALLDFEQISEADWSHKTSPEKWSKREILGHLIDSAGNNLRRFVVTQYEPDAKIVYYQNEWVRYQDYQGADTQSVVALWELLNVQIARTMQNIPADRLQLTCDTGNNGVELHTLAFLIDDYLAHVQHHLRQITNVIV